GQHVAVRPPLTWFYRGRTGIYRKNFTEPLLNKPYWVMDILPDFLNRFLHFVCYIGNLAGVPSISDWHNRRHNQGAPLSRHDYGPIRPHWKNRLKSTERKI
ncbi:MAG: hypothetical protein IJI24_03915, partial [Lachnospiraceae bacterium]|nr:hypothetical protein [Lachnospiraceae bacterium]